MVEAKAFIGSIKIGWISALLLGSLFLGGWATAAPIVADHNCTDVTQIPESAIIHAKASLHIAYGHTSHGSQLTTGMRGLVGFMNGLGYTPGLYDFNSGGAGGALDLRDTPFSGADDLGAPDRSAWATATRNYLDAYPEVNVIVWSWCGEVSDASEAQIDLYLSLMESLEQDYPNVRFVYMTGHLDGGGENGNLNLRNQQIRDYCQNHNKILYDFADIESYDPDALVNYMALLADDACDYDSDANGSRDQNWALNWQAAHTLNEDWYACSSAHSQPLNANRKAYAAWWLWARLAGWNECLPAPSGLTATPDPRAGTVQLTWQDNADSETGFTIDRQVDGGSWQPGYGTLPADNTAFTDDNQGGGALPAGTYAYRVSATNGQCTSGFSNTAQAVMSYAVPAAPANLQSNRNGSDVVLTWSDLSDNESHFVIERHPGSGAFGELVQLPADTARYTDTNLTASLTYTYRVRAINAMGSSGCSNETSQSIPDALVTIRLQDDDTGEVADAFLMSGSPDANYGSTQYLSSIDHFIIKFNLPAELLDKKIVDAQVAFFGWNQSGFTPGEVLDLYRVARPWNAATVTWNQADTGIPWNTAGGDYDAAQPVGQIPFSSGCDHCFYDPVEITGLVRAWADGTMENNGLILVNNASLSTGLKASEYMDNQRSYLEITYEPCHVDLDGDGDVDGADLAAMASGFDGACMKAFAGSLGTH
jgi:Disaggregatase related repeat/Fibronectin type III domain